MFVIVVVVVDNVIKTLTINEWFDVDVGENKRKRNAPTTTQTTAHKLTPSIKRLGRVSSFSFCVVGVEE